MSTSVPLDETDSPQTESFSLPEPLAETARCDSIECPSGHPNLHRDNSWDDLSRPRTCKLSATLKKRSHNHYIPSCMHLGKIIVAVSKVSVDLQEIADLVAEGSGAEESEKVRDSQLDAHEMASLTTMLKEVRVEMTVKSNGEEWHILRHLHQLIEFDEWLHKCCVQRCAKYNNLFDLRQTFAQSYRSFSPSNLTAKKQMEIILQYYFKCFSSLSGQPEFCSKLVCPLVLDILDLDCKGQRQSLADRYNTQGIELAVAVRDFHPACEDELALTRGDYLAVTYVSVNLDSPTWWEGKIVPKEEFETGSTDSCDHGALLIDGKSSIQRRRRRIGFFPSNCVRIVGPGETPDSWTRKEQQLALQEQKVNEPFDSKEQQKQKSLIQQQQQQPDAAASTSRSAVRTKYPRLLDSLRAFFRSRPDQGQLIRTGILRNGQFGSDLASYLAENNLDYPPVLLYCVSLIESHGGYREGLYRKSGNGSEVQRLMQAFEYGNQPDDRCSCVLEAPLPPETPTNFEATGEDRVDHSSSFEAGPSAEVQAPIVDAVIEVPVGDSSDNSLSANQMPVCPYRAGIHNYTNLLKTYFRELAVPLLAEQFSACQPEVSQLKECVAQMSPVHLRIARYLFSHLNRLANHSDKTLMPSHNLAIVWAPNLCQQPAAGATSAGIVEAARISQHQANIVACLIDKCDELFAEVEPRGKAASRVLDVIMPVQASQPRGFERNNPLAASIRRNSSSASSPNSMAAAAAIAAAAASSSGGRQDKSNRWAKAKQAKQKQKEQQQKKQQQKLPLSLTTSSGGKKSQRRSASDDDGLSGGSRLAESSTPSPPPPQPSASSKSLQSLPTSVTPNAAEALDLATVAPPGVVNEKTDAEEADFVPKFSVRKAIGGGAGGSMRQTDSSSGPSITVKRAQKPPQLTRGDSQKSNVSCASAASNVRLLPHSPQQQNQ